MPPWTTHANVTLKGLNDHTTPLTSSRAAVKTPSLKFDEPNPTHMRISNPANRAIFGFIIEGDGELARIKR
jgi:hypothetical protein